MSVHYAAAESNGWFGVIRDGLAVVFDVDVRPEVVESAWTALSGDSALATLLDTLTRDGLSSTPPFAAVEFSAARHEVRAIVRGGVSLVVTDLDGREHTLSGAGAATWIERHFSSAVSATLTVDAATAVDRTPPLPVDSAAVVVAALSIVLTDDRVRARAAPSAEPEVASVLVTDAGAAEPIATVPLITPVIAEPSGSHSTTPDESTLAATPGSESGATQAESASDLSGDTVVRPPRDREPDADAEPVSVHPVVETPGIAAPEVVEGDAEEGDHDGETIMTSDIAALRGSRQAGRESAASNGDAAPATPAAPSLSVRLPDGSREPLVQPVLVGRAPSVSKVSGGSLPRLVSLGAGDQDISRNHAQVALEGDTIVVTDLHSRNGTFIVLPGKSPQKLRAGEPTPVIVGTVIDLGGGISLTVDED